MKTDKLILIGNIYGPTMGTSMAGNIWDARGITPAIMTMGGGNRQPMIIEYEQTENGADLCESGKESR